MDVKNATTLLKSQMDSQIALDILSLCPATPENMKGQYKRLSLKYHPDKNTDKIERAILFRRLKMAPQEVLSHQKFQEHLRRNKIYLSNHPHRLDPPAM